MKMYAPSNMWEGGGGGGGVALLPPKSLFPSSFPLGPQTRRKREKPPLRPTKGRSPCLRQKTVPKALGRRETPRRKTT